MGGGRGLGGLPGAASHPARARSPQRAGLVAAAHAQEVPLVRPAAPVLLRVQCSCLALSPAPLCPPLLQFLRHF